jgi:hypothetical protein
MWNVVIVEVRHERQIFASAIFYFFLRPRDMGLAGNPHRHPLQAAFCKHD